MSAPDLSIVLVNWNTRDLLLSCLASLPAGLGGCSAEIWVVDNGSSDGSVAAVAAAHPEVRLMANRDNRGFAAANNQAIAASRGRYIVLLNSDTLVRPGALAALARFLDVHREVGIVGPELRNGDGSLQHSWAAFPTLGSELLGRNVRARRPYTTRDGGEAYSVDWVGGACFVIRREAIAQVGLLDEQYFMYSEEADWCWRARQRGWLVCYYPAAPIVHLGGQSSRMASARMRAELYRSKLIFFYKHRGLARSTALALALQAGFVARGVLAWAWWRLRPGRTEGGQPLRDALLPALAVGQTMLQQSRGRLLQANRLPPRS